MIGKCSILGGLCVHPKKATCDGCKLFEIYAEYKESSVLMERIKQEVETQKCGDCQHFHIDDIGKNGAVFGHCKRKIKKAHVLYASTKACKRKLDEVEE